MSTADKLLANPGALTNMVRRVALEAGAIILKYYDEGHGEVFSKSDNTPVTKADREAEILIEKKLAEILPGVPFVGEEASSEGRIPDTSNAEYFWLVDPLDGTQDFIAGTEDFTVNIGLIKNGAPFLGVIYAPARGEVYAGHTDKAVRWTENNNNEKEIRIRSAPRGGITVVTSKGKKYDPELEKYLGEFKVEKVLRYGSSLKICAVASGKADMYPRFGRTGEWDTAAGDAILRAAGGRLETFDEKPLVYGVGDGSFINPPFVALGDI